MYLLSLVYITCFVFSVNVMQSKTNCTKHLHNYVLIRQLISPVMFAKRDSKVVLLRVESVLFRLVKKRKEKCWLVREECEYRDSLFKRIRWLCFALQDDILP